MTQFVLLTFLLLFPAITWSEVSDVDSGATGDTVSVTSATAGTRVGPDAIKTAIRVRVPLDAAVPVCFNYVNRTASCATGLTDPAKTGYCASAGEAYIYPVAEEHWRGQLCAILSSGTDAVTLGYNAW